MPKKCLDCERTNNDNKVKACVHCGSTNFGKKRSSSIYYILTEHFVDFDGRETRAVCFFSSLQCLIIILALCIIPGGVVFAFLFCLLILLPSISLTIRRLHDINLSGWFCLITLIPIIDIISFIVLCLVPGSSKWNSYDINDIKPNNSDDEKELNAKKLEVEKLKLEVELLKIKKQKNDIIKELGISTNIEKNENNIATEKLEMIENNTLNQNNMEENSEIIKKANNSKDVNDNSKLICPKCNTKNNRINSFCTQCHYRFNEENKDNTKNILKKLKSKDRNINKDSKIICPKCNTKNNRINSFCTQCHYRFTEEDRK